MAFRKVTQDDVKVFQFNIPVSRDRQVFGTAAIVGRKWDGGLMQDWKPTALRAGDKRTNPYLGDYLRFVAQRLKVTDLYAPIPDFSGRVCAIEELDTPISLGGGVTFHSGTSADMVELPANSCYFLAAAGCEAVLLTDGERTIAGHIGLRTLEQYNNPTHRNGIEQASERFPDPRKVRAQVFFSIRPEVLTHPVDHEYYGPENVQLRGHLEARYPELTFDDRVRTDLPAMTSLDCKRFGMQMMHSTATYLPDDPHFVHTRMDQPYKSMRNGIFLVRRGTV